MALKMISDEQRSSVLLHSSHMSSSHPSVLEHADICDTPIMLAADKIAASISIALSLV